MTTGLLSASAKEFNPGSNIKSLSASAQEFNPSSNIKSLSASAQEFKPSSDSELSTHEPEYIQKYIEYFKKIFPEEHVKRRLHIAVKEYKESFFVKPLYIYKPTDKNSDPVFEPYPTQEYMTKFKTQKIINYNLPIHSEDKENMKMILNGYISDAKLEEINEQFPHIFAFPEFIDIVRKNKTLILDMHNLTLKRARIVLNPEDEF
jgi:hypothetical protein